MKRFATILLALVMILSLTIGATAQTVSTEANGTGTITIKNASKGVTYSIYKLFDATVSADNASIAYTGTIPESLSAYFTKDSVGNITATDAAKNGSELTEAAIKALTEWAKTASATASVVSDGSELVFAGLEYGYYVVTTTQGTAISVDSTNPNATVVDKNNGTPKDLNKKVNDVDVYVGQTVTYTVTFQTSNFDGAGETAQKIEYYEISDTLPDFLKNVKVTSIKIGNQEYLVNDAVPQFDANNKIRIPWVDENKNSLYENGTIVTITYTAVVTDKAAIDGDGNTNTVTLDWGGDEPLTDTETIFTYAIALKKVDENGNPLAGAKFEIPGYVKPVEAKEGYYIYAGNAPGEGLTNVITTPASGVVVVMGVDPAKFTIIETEAPQGYNKLTAPVQVEAVKLGQTSTNVTFYLDNDGNVYDEDGEGRIAVNVSLEDVSANSFVVVNKSGSELPTTGGMGTTMFYLFGGIMVLAAVVLLVTKKRMSNVQ